MVENVSNALEKLDMNARIVTLALVWFLFGGWMSSFGDVISLNSGELLSGDVTDFEDGTFVGFFTGTDRDSFRVDEVRRITFASGRQGTLTTTAGKTGTFPMSSFETGRFVCMKSSVETASIQADRILKAKFFSAASGFSATSSSSAGWNSAQQTHGSSYSTGGYTASSPSRSTGGYTPSYRSTSSHSGGGQSTHSSYSGGRVWVDGYYRSDGTWVEGHWREPAGMGTSTYPSYHGGSTYVHGYYRKDGTYVRGHTRRQ